MEKSIKRVEFEEAHADIVKLVEELVTKKNISLLQIAGIMQATATRIYKEVLSEDEFISLMAMVVDQSTELGAEKETLH